MASYFKNVIFIQALNTKASDHELLCIMTFSIRKMDFDKVPEHKVILDIDKKITFILIIIYFYLGCVCVEGNEYECRNSCYTPIGLFLEWEMF